jgi:hypothetical protein
MFYTGLHRHVNRVAKFVRRSALLLCLLVSVSLVGGVAIAATDHSNGGQRQNGNKTGLVNKDPKGCPEGYDSTTTSSLYDLNGDGIVCFKTSDGVTYYTDNNAN